ncbi:metal-dependent phosphohydrolase [Moorena producens JHB]|uniref:Metal-dependent phosphohydrolase n=1 Tax=Moorena producens (strain JHB) TaxID=1454205 RepID=A0A1D9FXP8_MOOP1|nr:DICT sensory domain-containing protein [Moorena producens]AOY80111.1 metal-dependent phosphohydrolase [Moorena producens JHB]
MRSGSILQKLEQAHRGTKKPLSFGVYYKNTLVSLCHALEDFILESDSAPLMITAFQRGKWYLEEAERYGDIAVKSSQVVILAAPDTGFAEHPTSQRSNVALVSLDPSDPVAQEWHLIIISETYTAMVLCQELSESDYGTQGLPEQDRERKFYGFWTFEPDLVRETVEFAIAHIGNYNRDLQASLTAQLQQMIDSTKPRDYIGAVVNRVVNYLQKGQQELPPHTSPSHVQVLDDNLVSNEMQAFLRMAQLIDQADAVNPKAGAEVKTLSETIGQLLDLPAWQLKRLSLAALLHRLSPLQGVKIELSPQSAAQKEVVQKQESLPKASVLRIMPRLQAVANIITHQTESWDGSGQPDGLAYDNIPLESRILRLMAYFQQQLNTYKSEEDALSVALRSCQALSGEAFDPKLVETLGLIVMGMQQGMSLQANQPKIASGMWLLDSLSEEKVTVEG